MRKSLIIHFNFSIILRTFHKWIFLVNKKKSRKRHSILVWKDRRKKNKKTPQKSKRNPKRRIRIRKTIFSMLNKTQYNLCSLDKWTIVHKTHKRARIYLVTMTVRACLKLKKIKTYMKTNQVQYHLPSKRIRGFLVTWKIRKLTFLITIKIRQRKMKIQ